MSGLERKRDMMTKGEKKKEIEAWMLDVYGDKISFYGELIYLENINYTRIETPFGLIFIRHCSPSHKGDIQNNLWNFL